jgi:L-seryl-tRNA(Ser) seleniumtransferase
LIIAILESVLGQYLAPNVENLIPALKMAHEDAASVRLRAQTLVDWMNQNVSSLRCDLISTSATFGGGTLPGESLPSSGICLSGKDNISRKVSANYLAQLLRLADVPVISMVHEDKVLIDLRTVPPQDEMLLRQSLLQVDHRVCAL